MKRYEVTEAFGLENLTPGEGPRPEPGPGEIRIALSAVSLNYRDLLMVTGQYNPRQPLPLVPCSDGVGTVEAVGPGVTRFVPGDRVCPLFSQRWIAGEPTPERLRSTLGGPLDGTLRSHMTLPAEGAVAAPEHLSDAEAACLPCAALTAWSALVTLGDLTAGDTLLVLGTGGVSISALQLGVALGARVIVTSSSDAKLERARDLGAWQTLNYRRDEAWGKTVRQLTGGRGVDQVLEVGGAGTLEQSLKAVRPGGTVSVIGVLAGVKAPLSVLPVLMQQVRLQGVLVGHRDGFEAMNRALAANSLHPVVDRVFPFDEARAAFDHLASARHFGKVVIETT
ncbi:MAG: NAD(P)-dependent alcohol dehydrogenase [Acidobacteriota bacterium]